MEKGSEVKSLEPNEMVKVCEEQEPSILFCLNFFGFGFGFGKCGVVRDTFISGRKDVCLFGPSASDELWACRQALI